MKCDGAEPPGAARALGLLQARHMLAALRALLDGPHRFCELWRLSGAPSATTLSVRLRELEAEGVVRGCGGVYTLTGRGSALGPLFATLGGFTRRHPVSDPEAMLAALGARYALGIMRELTRREPDGGEAPREVRFNELQRALGAPSATTLTRRLGELERLGLIRRRVVSTRPPHTLYACSEAGEAFGPVVGEIVAWGEANLGAGEEEVASASA
ncbi:winged helix-turn-helix transcriptional regulator [Deinococcus sp. YIM 134068]|uniref:winged helix-turn-helix transcriptional regulator n=1 Tax=Deinococcus lichenicola TaxID=3118910 RepID=UPI002F930E56